jgi:hypothetical protein
MSSLRSTEEYSSLNRRYVLSSRDFTAREFAADEFSAFFTRKSLSVASALLKISRHQGLGPGNLAVVSVVGVGWYQNGPQLKERVMRFVRIADHLEFINLRTRSRFSESRRSLVSGDRWVTLHLRRGIRKVGDLPLWDEVPRAGISIFGCKSPAVPMPCDVWGSNPRRASMMLRGKTTRCLV